MYSVAQTTASTKFECVSEKEQKENQAEKTNGTQQQKQGLFAFGCFATRLRACWCEKTIDAEHV